MNIHYYKADSLADAFELASRDTKTWTFPAMEALTELAADARKNSLRGEKVGMGVIYSCSLGHFQVFDDSKKVKEYGIALVGLNGRESGIDDPAAAEILEFHRDRPEKELYAEQLLVFSEYVPDINVLDAGYELLTQAKFLVRTDSIVQVTAGDEKVERPKYRLRRPGEKMDLD